MQDGSGVYLNKKCILNNVYINAIKEEHNCFQNNTDKIKNIDLIMFRAKFSEIFLMFLKYIQN